MGNAMTLRIVWLVLLCVALGFGLANVLSSPPAIAQQGDSISAARFQVSAYAGMVSQSLLHGAYVIDTTTGKVWQVQAGGEPMIVAEKLK
jgi:hypothetical protein